MGKCFGKRVKIHTLTLERSISLLRSAGGGRSNYGAIRQQTDTLERTGN